MLRATFEWQRMSTFSHGFAALQPARASLKLADAHAIYGNSEAAPAAQEWLGAIKPSNGLAWLDLGSARLSSRLEPSQWQH